MDVGPYSILGEVGRGGMGAVFRARGRDGSDVAVKLLLADRTGTALQRFDRERRLLAQLGAEVGFVPLLDAGMSRDGPWLAMPLLAGGSLRDRLKRSAFSIDEAVALGIALARALGRAHAAGIIHRDLKPENVLFDASGRPFISDLGLAKHFRNDAPGASRSISLTQEGEVAGTVGYMAPEQIGMAKDVGPQADVFALGAILYESLAGRAAFEGDSIHAVMAKVSQGEIVPLRRARPGTPRWLARVVDRALALDALKRWRNGDALAVALEQGPALDEKRRAVALVATLALAAVGATVALFPRGREPPAPPAPVASPAPAPRPVEPEPAGPPAWWHSLAPEARAKLPLPRGVVFGKASGEYVSEKDGSVLVFVPGGKFVFGNDAIQDASFTRPVSLEPYFIGKYEVTNAQFEQFARTGYLTSSERSPGALVGWGLDSDAVACPGASWRAPEAKGAWPPDHPVVQLSWADARAYCDWAGLRLPRDAEWERAAAWDPKLQRLWKFPWGDDVPRRDGPRVANLFDASAAAVGGRPTLPGYDDSFVMTAPVGSFPAGASPIGALDMGGNVREWCDDVHLPLDQPFAKGPSSLDDLSPRVVRGSSFASTGETLRVTFRNDVLPITRRSDIGFRVARDAR